MPLIIPEAKIEYLPPWNDGVSESIGISRDWTELDGKLNGIGFEYIKPLNCVAPRGDTRPSSMVSPLWYFDTNWNKNVRNVKSTGNPVVDWIEFYDGDIYPNEATYAALLVAAKQAYDDAYTANEAAASAAGYSNEEAAAYAKPFALAAYIQIMVDGSIKSNAYAAKITSTELFSPNLSFRLARYAPPERQKVVPQTLISIRAGLQVSLQDGIYRLDSNGTWVNGVVNLILPFESEILKNPILQFQVDLGGDTYSKPVNLSEASNSSSMEDDVCKEFWSIEYIEDPEKFVGGHILIRSSSMKTDSSSGKITYSDADYWHTYNPCVRLTTGVVTVYMVGTRQQINVSPIYYSSGTAAYDGKHAYCTDVKNLPSGKWNATATFGTLKTDASGWTVGVANKYLAVEDLQGKFSPVISFIPTTDYLTTRPIVWLITEDHPDIIGDAFSETKGTTENIHLLKKLNYSLDSTWKNSTATADFHRTSTEQLATWQERGKCNLIIGWQATPAPSTNSTTNSALVHQSIGNLYIMPGGIDRDRVGDEQAGNTGVRIQFGDFVSARMRNSDAIDFRQAGGRKVGEWFKAVGNRLGLSDSFISIDNAVKDLVIPITDEVPSKPSFACGDGTSWESHVSAVTEAMNLRWGWKGTNIGELGFGSLFIDTGTPKYQANSTISFELDYKATAVEDRPLSIKHVKSVEDYRTGIKINYGPEGNKKELYFLKPDDERKTAGGDYWVFVDEMNAKNAAVIISKLVDEHANAKSAIEFVLPLRVGMLPDQFIKIKDVPELGLVTDSIYQITSVDGDSESKTTTVTAKVVAVPSTIPAPPPATNSSMGNGSL